MMRDFPRQKLQELVNHHGTTICRDVKLCSSLISVLCGEVYKQEAEVLIGALEEGIVKELLEPAADVSKKVFLVRLIQQLHTKRNFDKPSSVWAVRSWAGILGLLHPTSPPSVPLTVVPKVNGNQPPITESDEENVSTLHSRALCTFQSDLSALLAEHQPTSEEPHNPSLNGSNAVQLLESATGKNLSTPKGLEYIVSSTAFSSDGQFMATGNWNGTINIWDALTSNVLQTLRGHSSKVSDIAFSPDGTMFASGGWDHAVRLWKMPSGDLINTIEEHDGRITSIAFSSDGMILATASEDKTTKLWSIKTLLQKQSHPLHFFSRSKIRVLRSIYNALFYDKKRETGEPRIKPSCVLQEHGQVNKLVFSPTAPLLVSCNDEGIIKVWSLDTEVRRALSLFLFPIKLTHTLQKHQGNVACIAISPHGKLLASGGEDKKIILWDLTTGWPLYTLSGHQQAITSLTFSQDSRILASASRDQTVKLWNVVGGKLMRTLKGEGYRLSSVAFNAQGQMITSGSFEETMIIRQ